MPATRVYDLVPASTSPLLDTSLTEDLKLLSVSLAAGVGGQRDVAVSGISSKVVTVTVTASFGIQSARITSTPDSSTGLFGANFPGLVTGAEVLHITAKSSSGAALDHAAIAVNDAYPISLPSAVRALLPTRRSQFVAGVPDRIVRRHQFAPLNYLSYFTFFDIVSTDGKSSWYFPARAIRKIMEPTFKDISKKAASGIIDQAAFRDQVIAAWKRAAQKSRLKLIESDQDEPGFAHDFVGLINRTLGAAGKKIKIKKGRLDAIRRIAAALPKPNSAQAPGTPRAMAMAPPNLGFDPTGSQGPVIVTTPDFGGVPELFPFKLKRIEDASRVGILFGDRLRFQSAGLLPGEQIYTLALSPGEEVQLRQTVETKRRLTTEDIKDREQEKSSTLTSTWTTDLSEAVTDTSTQQQAVNANLSAEIPIPETPISLGPSINLSGSGAHTDSKQISMRTGEQITSVASARMRSQHKIRLEITDETASSFASTRTIRNPNQQRAATFVFHKLYRKERVLLERYNARLCLRLVLNQPAAATRAAFLTALDKLDPDNPANYSVTAPKMHSAEASISPSRIEVYPGSGDALSPEDGFNIHIFEDIDLITVSKQIGNVAVSANFVLADLPVIEVESFTFDGESYSGATLFRQFGGSFDGNHKWDKAPTLGVKNPKGKIVAKTFVDEEGWWRFKTMTSIGAIRLKLRSNWMPGVEDLAAYYAAKAVEREILMGALTPDALFRLRDIAKRDFPNTVLAEVFSTHLQPPPRTEALNQMFDLSDMVMETVPWWATESGRRNFYDLETRLERLPGVLSAADVLVDALTASQVIVYLPVNEGFEQAALALLSDISPEERTRLADEVISFRNANFPDLTASLESPDAVSGPAYPPATLAGSAVWENPWERLQRRFLVLAHWSEMVPTDGVHIETLLSETVATDEHRETQLENGRIT